MQSLEPANDEIDYIQLGFAGDLTEFGEEIEVEICDGEGEAEAQAVQIQAVVPSLEDSRSSNVPIENKEEVVQKQPFCIFQRLRQLYREEVSKEEPAHLALRLTSFLLEKLVRKESFNMIVITLNPVPKGYYLFISASDGKILQETHQPYTQDILLDYIDHEELPPQYIGYWEQTFPQLFYSGCVIAQIKDLRFTSQPRIRHILLKPHTQSLINDVNLITTEENRFWSSDEKLGLESAIFNSVQGPLCLDPSPFAGLRRFHAHRTKNTLASLRNTVKRHCQTELNRKRKIEQSVSECNKHLAQFIINKESVVSDQILNISSSTSISSILPNKEQKNYTPLPDITKDVTKLAKHIERPPESSECTPQLVEQYILETERPSNTTYHIKLSILQRPSNCEYLGHLYVDKEYKEGESNGASCRFSLGTRARANNYIKQFTKIFTEEGRKSVRITHLVPGQPARVTCTAGMVEREAAKASTHLRIQTHPKQKFFQVLSAKSAQQLKVQKSQKEAINSVNFSLNGLLTPINSASSSNHQSNGSLLNGEIPATPVSSPSSPQVSKASLMTNPAISALANSFRNSVQQYQQQAAAAAAANTNASSSSIANHSLSGSSSASSSNTVASAITNSTTSSNAAILTLLNSSGSTSNQALNQLLNQPPQQKLVARKMTITNLINSRLRPSLPNTSTGNNSVRVPLSTLATQLTSPPQNQTVSNSSTISSPLTPTLSVQTLNSNSGRHLKQGNVQMLTNIQNLSGSLPSASGVQSLANVQTIHRLSGTKETSSVNSAGQTVPTSSLGLSMPGLSALLAGTPSAEDSPSERLSSNSQGANLNLASLQASMASIPGLQNVQVSIPGLAVPISVSLNVSTPHIVTASSLPSASDHC